MYVHFTYIKQTKYTYGIVMQDLETGERQINLEIEKLTEIVTILFMLTWI